MIALLDSAAPPTQAQAQAAAAAGVSGWNGYIATRAGLGLLRPWSQAEFDVVRHALPAQPIGFCSGWDDPVLVRSLASQYGVRLCLDVESGIRDDGPWVDAFLAASGAGLYGLLSVHYHPAPFHVVADYLGYDPGASWPVGKGGGPGPGLATGWQWQNSHQEFGVEVDRGWYDDWFLNGAAPSSAGGFFTSGGDDMVALSTPAGRLDLIYVGTDGHVYHRWQNTKINDLSADVESWGGGVVKVSACYTDGGATIAIFAAVANGDIWFKEVGTDGHVVNEWAQMGGGATVLVQSGVAAHTHQVSGTAA